MNEIKHLNTYKKDNELNGSNNIDNKNKNNLNIKHVQQHVLNNLNRIPLRKIQQDKTKTFIFNKTIKNLKNKVLNPNI